MLIRIHDTDFDGRPVDCTGEFFGGRNALDIIESMKLNPFQTSMTPRAYMHLLLRHVCPGGPPPLPEDDLAAAECFLDILVKHGFAAWEKDA